MLKACPKVHFLIGDRERILTSLGFTDKLLRNYTVGLLKGLLNAFLVHMLFSELEQFKIRTYLAGYITVEMVILIFVGFFCYASYCVFDKITENDGFLVIPNSWQALLEIVHNLIVALVKDNVRDETASKFFPVVFTVFFLITLLNLIGLIPYSFTLTSHLIITFTLSLSLFLGINIIACRKYGIKIFSLFLPAGTSVLLALLLVPIELISYVFKPISLSIRLFANMMAGHTLLKVIAGFSVTMSAAGGFLFFILHYVPLLILIPLFALELGVALIQAFVFTILVCIYINDAINITH